MNIDDLVRDYLFSNFGNIRGSRDESVPSMYFDTLKEFNKTNLQLCTEAYLISCGVSQTQLNTIKGFMLVK